MINPKGIRSVLDKGVLILWNQSHEDRRLEPLTINEDATESISAPLLSLRFQIFAARLWE